MAGSTTDGRYFQPLFLLFLVFCSFLFLILLEALLCLFHKSVSSFNFFLISNWLISIALSFVWQHWAESGILVLQPGVKPLLFAVKVQHPGAVLHQGSPPLLCFQVSDPPFCLT